MSVIKVLGDKENQVIIESIRVETIRCRNTDQGVKRKTIKKATGMSDYKLTKKIDVLVEHGVIKQERDCDDRRFQRLSLIDRINNRLDAEFKEMVMILGFEKESGET